uniref:BZIP domain-containing protein n=1 Tax=Caenorhabditis tropicalis TaxID=1561998 RepID=A0A1I7TY54_9PELO
MASFIRSFFKSKRVRKDFKDETTGNEEDYLVFQPCQRSASLKRPPQTRFANDCMLPATAAYHTTSAPRLRKGPQSCPEGNIDDEDDIPRRRQAIRIDASEDRRQFQSQRDLTRQPRSDLFRSGSMRNPKTVYDFRSDDDDGYEKYRKSRYSQQDLERQRREDRREDRRKQEKLEKKRANYEHAMANMAYCMASVQQMEQLKRERDQYRKEMSRYKTRCEKLENRVEQMEQRATPSFGSMQPLLTNPMLQSPFHTPQFPPPLSFQYPNPMGMTSSSHQNNLQNVPPHSQNFMPPAPLQNFHRSTDFLNMKGLQQQLPYSGNGHLNSKHGGSTSFTLSNTPTTIGSEGAGESLVNPSDLSFLGDLNFKAPSGFDDSDEDEIKNYRFEAPSSMSELTQSTTTTQ